MKKTVCIILALAQVLLLCGCDIFTADTAELLSPPPLTGDIYPIAEAIKESAAGAYTLKYPSRGNHRSAVVQYDINSDGVLEAFALYSMTDGEVMTMHINAVCFKDGEWRSVAQQKIIAGGVDRVDFCDLDGDGAAEILVGWEIYGTSQMQLAVYSLGENSLTQRMLQRYNHFITCDLDEDDRNEVMIIRTASAEQQNTASLYILTDDGVAELSNCSLDSTVKTVNEPQLSTLSSGKPAVYIDEIKGVGAVTEVLFIEKGVLVNPLLSKETGETISTLRSVLFSIKDINNDGIIEIPVQVNVPSVSKSEVNEKLYFTNWCSFNGETLTNQMTTMINTNDSYYYIIPQKWIGRVAVLKDTARNLRELYRYNPEDMTAGERLMYIKAVDKQEWDSGKHRALNAEEIVNDSKTTYVCYLSEAAIADGIDIEKVKADFKLYE